MTKNTCDSEILVTISHEREIEIDEELQINLRLPNNLGNVQELLAVFNRQNENPCIIKGMNKTKEENDFIEYETKVSFLPFNRYENYFFFFRLKIDGQENLLLRMENRHIGEYLLFKKTFQYLNGRKMQYFIKYL